MSDEIKIRGLDPNIVLAIDRNAAACHQSRNEYLVALLTNFTSVRSAEDMENKYTRLVLAVSKIIQSNNELCDRVARALENFESIINE